MITMNYPFFYAYYFFTMTGQPINFTLQYNAMKNYPIDLYYLMDVSASMRDDKDKLLDLAESLVNAS